MTTVAFAGSTIWDDSSTGWGPVELVLQGAAGVWMEEHLPGDEGVVMKYLGGDPGGVYAVMQYLATDTEIATLKGTLEGLKGSLGTVSKNSGGTLGTLSVGNCVLRRPVSWATRGGAVRLGNGNLRRLWVAWLEWRVVE